MPATGRRATIGSATDTSARLYALELSAQLKQHIVVDNRPGRGGAIGMKMLAKSTPEQALIAAGFRELSRGQAWSQNCREWVYFDCFLPLHPIRQKFRLADCVEDHDHFGTHDGQESGFVCTVHHDGIMGYHPDSRVKAKSVDP